jgi:tetratricopeptide (TPR) repeat protein
MTEEREHLQRLIEFHRANLQHYKELEAKFGLDCPVYVKNAQEEARKGLAEARAKLAALEGHAPGAGPSIPTIPQNLPARGEFIGREREMEQVRQALASRFYLVVIEGIGGIGKTALALEVAHELWEKGLYEAVVWTTARGREIGLHDIIDTIAHTLNYPYITQLPPEEKPTEVVRLLRSKKCLLLVDSYEDIKDKEVPGFLLNLPEPSKALITSKLHALGEARVIPLKGMEQGEALALMRAEGQRLGLKSVQRAGDEILLRLHQATGGAPLAIKWAVGQIKFGQTLDVVLDGLYEAVGFIFEYMFDRSWDLLTDHARRILMTMPIFVTSASKGAIEAASHVHTWDLDEGLGQLVEMSLVEVSGRLEEQQRYSVHPLVRAFARAKLRESKLEEAYHLSAARYFLDYFEPYAGYRNWLGYRGYPKMAMDLENLLTIREWCWTRGDWALVLEFQRLLSRFLDAQETWHQRLQLGQQALQAAEHLKDEPARLKALLEDMGWTYARLGGDYYQRARDLAQKALQIAETLGDAFYIARSHNLLGTISRYKRDYEPASEFYEKALKTAESMDDRDRRLIASLNADLGCVAHKIGQLDEAERRFEYARDALEKLGDESRLARVLCYLGDLASDRGDAERAKSFYEKGLSMSQKTGRLFYVAEALLGLAKVEEGTGNFTQALPRAQQAMEIYRRLGTERRIKEASQLVEQLEQATAEQESTTDEES